MKTVTFPKMGDYSVPAYFFLKHTLNASIIIPDDITTKTLEIGTNISPEFVCMPFKYTIGTLLEGLNKGANVLIQLGGGCRYGYYAELQEEILKDMGYDFEYINLVSKGKANPYEIYKKFKKIDPKFNLLKAIHYLLITKKMIEYMDNIDDYIRKNIGFEVEIGSFKKTKKEMLEEFKNTKNSYTLKRSYKKYLKIFKNIKTNKPLVPLKIGIIGELYTVMEPFSNYYLEEYLAKHNIEITRFTNAKYLLFEKKKKIKKYLKEQTYVKYKMGADASDNIARTVYLCKNKYDGIIHIKSSFCTPEIGAMPIINKIAESYKVPIIFFSFGDFTSKTGIETRLEALIDMIEMRKKNE